MNHPIHEDEEGPGLLISPSFWGGLFLSVAAWTVIWVGIAGLLGSLQ